MSDVVGVKMAKTVQITGVEQSLNGFAFDVAPGNPDQRANPERHLRQIKSLARRERIEIADERVKTVFVLFDSVKQRANLARSFRFAPFGKTRF